MGTLKTDQLLSPTPYQDIRPTTPKTKEHQTNRATTPRPTTSTKHQAYNTQHQKPDSQQGAPPTYHSHQPSSYYQTTTILSQHQHHQPNTNGDPQSANTINTEREPPAPPAPRPTACQPEATNVDLSSSTYHQQPASTIIANAQYQLPTYLPTSAPSSIHLSHQPSTYHFSPILSQQHQSPHSPSSSHLPVTPRSLTGQPTPTLLSTLLTTELLGLYCNAGLTLWYM